MEPRTGPMAIFPPTAPELQEQVIRLSQEKRELQDYAERVTKELRRYQQARPTPPASPEDDLPLPPWATNMQMMSPLLFSYEERIAELEAVIERSVSLAEQAQILTKENDSLRVELHERTEQLRNAQLMAPAGIPAKDGLGADDQEELRELYRLSVEQNEALAQQNQLLKLQLEKMQHNLALGQQQAREVYAHAEEAARASAEEQARAEILSKHKTAAELELDGVRGDLVAEVQKREDLQLKVQGLMHELQDANKSLSSYKRTITERTTLAAEEVQGLQHDLSRTTTSEREHRQKVNTLQRQITEVTEHLFNARREADSTQQEAAQMLQLMESMERKLRDITSRHDDVQNKLQDEERQVADLLLEKDWWTSEEQASKRQMERRESRLQRELEALRQQREQDLSSLQTSEARLVADLEDRLKKSEQSVADFQNKADAASRQAKWESSAMERQLSMHKLEKDRLQTDLEELQQARLRAERHADAHQQELARIRAAADHSSAELREGAMRSSTEMASYATRCQGAERQVVQGRDELQTAEARVDVLSSELQESRRRSSEELDTERRKAQAQARTMERQLQAMQAKAQQDEQRAAVLLQRDQALRLRWQTELGHEKEALEVQVERLSRENRAMREKSRSVLKALAARRGLPLGGQSGLGLSEDLGIPAQ